MMYRGTGYDQYGKARVWADGETEYETAKATTLAANEFEKKRTDLKINSFHYKKLEETQ